MCVCVCIGGRGRNEVRRDAAVFVREIGRVLFSSVILALDMFIHIYVYTYIHIYVYIHICLYILCV